MIERRDASYYAPTMRRPTLSTKQLKDIAGPGYGRYRPEKPDPDKDPQDEDDSVKAYLHKIYLWLKQIITGQESPNNKNR